MAFRLRHPAWLLVPMVLVAVYALVGFFVVPGSAARAIRDYTTQQLHRESSVGLIRFNPFLLDAEVHDFVLKDADQKPMVGFSRLHVRLGLWASILRRGYVVSIVELDNLAVNAVRHADQSINLAALAPPTTPQAKPAAQPAKALPRVFIDAFALRDGAVAVNDEARREALHLLLKPVSFELKEFRTTGEENAYGFSAKTTRGESLDWRGTFGLAPVESTGTFELGHILATTMAQIGLDLLPLDVTKGEIDLSGKYHFVDAGTAPQLKVDIPTVRVRDLGLRARGEAQDWVTIPAIAIDGTSLDLASQSIGVNAVRIDKPRITAWLDHDGNLNLAKLYSTKAALAEAAPTDKIEKPWKVSAPLLQITGLDANVEDRKPQHPVVLHLDPVDVTVRNFALPLTAPIALDLKAGVNKTGDVHVSGPVFLDPVSATLAVDARSIDLPVLQPYLDEFSRMDLLKGDLSARLSVDYKAGTAGAAAPISVKGDVSVKAVHTQDKTLHLDFVNWNLLALKDLELHSAPFSVQIREVIANQPYARVVIAADGSTNIPFVLDNKKPTPVQASKTATARPAAAAPNGKRGGPAAAVPAKPAPQDQPVAIHLIRIENGSMNFADQSVRPPFATGVQSLSGTVRGLSGKTGTRADVDLKGKVDRYAPVTIEGKINPLSAESFTDIKLAFRNLELTTFSPYAGKFAGYRVEKGKLSVEFAYRIENRQLDARHHLILDQLELGEKVDSPDATGLPVKFAISLLKDTNGVIDLDVPVGGSLDDPKFRFGSVIWKVVVNLIEKAVTAPFKLLGSLFGGSKPPEFIAFAPASAELDQAAVDEIQGLRKGLAARPALKLDVPMAICADADGAALAAGAWTDHVRTLARARLAGKKAARGLTDDGLDAYLEDPKNYRKVLEDAYQAEHGVPAPVPPAAAGADPDDAAITWLEASLKPMVAAPAGALTGLGKARAEAVQRALIDNGGVDPTRVFLVTDKDTVCSDALLVQMKLGLK